MIKSLTALPPSVVSPCASSISFPEVLGQKLHAWLQLVSDHPLPFACKAHQLDTIGAQFPCLVITDGAPPNATACSSCSFAPSMGMRHLRASRLLLHRILSSAAALSVACVHLFLLSPASTYLRADTCLELLPKLTPNMTLHFKIRSGWPAALVDPLSDFCRSKVTSQMAQTCDCIAIEVHSDHPSQAADAKLMTAR